MAQMGYPGARGKLIHEKNLNSKISCQTPFNKKNHINADKKRITKYVN